MSLKRHMDQVFVYACYDPQEMCEGIPSIHLGGHAFPLLGADEERVRSLRNAAKQVANESGKPVKLLKFSKREVIETIYPEKD